MSTPTMSTPAKETQPVPQSRTAGVPAPSAVSTDIAWRPLYVLAAMAALLTIVLVAQAVFVFFVWPPPTTVENWFALLQRNGFLGLLELDLLLVASYVLLIPVYLALYAALGRTSQSYMAIALAFNVAGAVLILAANPSVAMFNLSNTYATAATGAQRAAALAAGQAVMANWSGTSFVLGYLLIAFATLITGLVMLHSKDFNKVTAYTAFAMGALMLVPASAGTVGLIFSLASLVPTVLFLVLVARRLFQMADVPLLGGSSYVMVHPK